MSRQEFRFRAFSVADALQRAADWFEQNGEPDWNFTLHGETGDEDHDNEYHIVVVQEI